VDCNGTLLAAV